MILINKGSRKFPLLKLRLRVVMFKDSMVKVNNKGAYICTSKI